MKGRLEAGIGWEDGRKGDLSSIACVLRLVGFGTEKTG